MHGIVDEKTDVFAFGVLLLELITGRRALDYSQQSLVIWVSLVSSPLFYDIHQLSKRVFALISDVKNKIVPCFYMLKCTDNVKKNEIAIVVHISYVRHTFASCITYPSFLCRVNTLNALFCLF